MSIEVLYAAIFDAFDSAGREVWEVWGQILLLTGGLRDVPGIPVPGIPLV